MIGGGVPVLGAFMFNAIYKFPAYQFSCQTVLTNKTWTDAYRGAGRPEATFAIERMMDELAAEVGVDPLRDPREELDQARGVPVHHGRRPGVRLRQLRGGHREGQGDLRVRRAAGRAEAAPGVERPRPARHRRLDVHRDVRPRASRVLGSLDYGAGGWEHATRADARRPARSRSSPVRPRTARATRRRSVADRRRPARRRRSRTSRCCTATPRSRTRAWTPTARARWSSVARRWSGPPTR